MRLKVPNNCGECFYAKRVFDVPVCTNPAIPEDWKQLDIRSFIVDLDKNPPKWCPYILTNKYLEVMPKRKQDAISNLMSSLKVLLGCDEVREDV